MHEMLISLSPNDNRLHVNWFSIRIPIEGIIEVECIMFENLYFINWDQDIHEISCNNVAPVTNLCLGRATTRSHSSQWSKKKVAVET